MGFPDGSDDEESACRETCVPSLGQEDPVEKEMATPLVFLPGESHEQRLQSTGSQRVGHN